MRLEDGIYHSGGTIEVKGSKTEIQWQTGEEGNNGIYVDDLIAFGRDVLLTKPTLDPYETRIATLLQVCLDMWDMRADEIRGYSHSQEE